MVFAETIQEAASKIDGCLGIIVMGMDGIAIERFDADPTADFEILATESTTLLRATRQAAIDTRSGALRELIFMTERMVVLTTAITEEYVILAAMKQGGNYGKARFLIRKAALRLEKEVR